MLETPEGDIELNACPEVYTTIGSESGYQYKPIHTGSSMSPGATAGGLRLTREPIPQAHGSLIHRRWKWGYEAQVTLSLWRNDEIAFGVDRRVMWDNLVGKLNSILNADGRFRWLPSGLLAPDQRMLDDVRLLSWPTQTYNDVELQTTWAIESPFPYGLDWTEITTAVTGSTFVVNTGSSEMYPVFKVYGPTAAFILTNLTTGLEIVYNSGLPGGAAIGGGDYVEIDTFRNTVYLNGNQANRKASIDILASDFWSLVKGSNHIGISGAACDMLWQAAWA